ncbi:hypothetical protein P154DRAFT_404187, partial [Amniculicola lignicola CBS 123094]
MSSRMRHSTAQPAATAYRSDQLPPYKKPSHPLSARAQDTLKTIPAKRNIEILQQHHQQAGQLITDAVEGMYDALRERKDYVERRRKKWDQGLKLDEKQEQERELQELEDKMNDMTKKLEVGMRGVIDGGSAVERAVEVMDWVRGHGVQQIQQDYNSQMSQRQSQSQRRRGRREQNSEGDEDEQEDDEAEATSSPGPTPFGAERLELTGPSEMFLDRLEREKGDYFTHSHTSRYSKNNAYIGFKSMVHEVKYGDSGPPLPPPESWFTERGSPAPGVTATQAGAEDDDIIIDKATISTRCPLTFRSYKEPVTSRKCPHTFEKSAIQEIIRQSNARTGGGGPRGQGEKAVQCPVSGCDQMLTVKDLYSDPVLVRKIRRMQQVEAQQNDAESGEEVDEEDEDEDEEEEIAPPRPRHNGNMKAEQMEQSMMSEEYDESALSATRRPPRSSHIVDLGDPSDDD